MNNIIDSIYSLIGLEMPILKTVIQVMIALIVLFIGLKIAKVLGEYIEKIVDQRKIDKTVKPFILSLINTMLKIVVLITVATLIGFEMASLACFWSVGVCHRYGPSRILSAFCQWGVDFNF